MLYLFEFFELNNLHVVTVIIPIIDYVHPKSVAETARIDCRCVNLLGIVNLVAMAKASSCAPRAAEHSPSIGEGSRPR